MELTQEQKLIIQKDLYDREIMKINAYAGVGKTSTLYEYAKVRPYQKFLYVAFNKSVQEEAKSKFPPNVECRTSHSLAWWGFGSEYQHKLVTNIKANEIRRLFNLDNYRIAKDILDTVNKYIVSADTSISSIHFPVSVNIELKKLVPIELKKALSEAKTEERKKDVNEIIQRGMNKEAEKVISYANELWNIMCDKENTQIGMIHDGYLKLFALSSPNLYKYDSILFDEFQDANAVTVDFVMQQRASKICIGDFFQQIYQFRGAVNALERINADYDFYLTNSFRLGQPIANLANNLLSTFKKETHKIIGKNTTGELGYVDGKHTIISRTNANLFKNAIRNLGKKLGFVGGVYGYKFDLLEDTYYLECGEHSSIKNGYIRSFSSFEDFESFAKDTQDAELLMRIRIVKEFGSEIPILIKRIQKQTQRDIKDADIIFTTAHKSKGLEFDNVKLSNDFTSLITDTNQIDLKLPPEELNLIYVALTRTLKILQINQKLDDFLNFKEGVVKEKVKIRDRFIKNEKRFQREYLEDDYKERSSDDRKPDHFLGNYFDRYDEDDDY